MTQDEYYQVDRPLLDELKAIEDRLYQKTRTGTANTDNEEFNSMLRKQLTLMNNRADLIKAYLSDQN